MKLDKNDNIFIVYEFVDNNDIPFYVGRTGNMKKRLHDHNKHIKSDFKKYTYNKIRKLINTENYSLKYNILYDNLTFDESVQLEIDIIKKYKDNGILLTNLTDGGEGTIGTTRIFTEEHKKNLKIARQKLLDSGHINPTKGKTYNQIYGETDAELKISKGKKTWKNKRDNGYINPTKGMKLEDIVGIEKANILKEQKSILAKQTFLGTKQKEDHIKKRSLNQSKTKKNWTDEQKQKVSDINRINGMKAHKTYNIKVILNDKSEHIINKTTYSNLSRLLLEQYNIKCNPQSISDILNNKISYLNTKHKCNFMLVQ